MSDNDDDITRPDMTRIEDLSEFFHEEDPEADAQLDLPATPEQEEPESSQTMSLEELEDDESPPTFSEDETEEEYPSFQNDNDESFSGESTQPDIEAPSFGELTEDEDEEKASFSSEDDTDEEVSFDSPTFEESAENDDESFSLEEMDTLDEEAKLQEEVDNEIQEALEEESFEMQDESLGHASEEDEVPLEEDEPIFESETEFEEPSEEDNTFEPLAEPEIETPIIQSINSPIEDSFSQSHKKELEPLQRENFKDLNEFGNAISYGQVAAGGNPPFSIVLRKIKYLEDSERIIETLREHGLCDESNEADFQQGLNNGSMLISQLNEYSAIYLAHKFRRFDLEILVGLSDEVHPSKNYDMDYKGLVRKENLTQNKQETFSLEEQVIQVDAILLATTPTLENYRIDRYLGLVSAHIMIEEEEFQKLQETDLKNKNYSEENIDPDELLRELDQDEPQSKTSSIEIGLEEIYQNLAESLKAKAFKMKGNAVVGINYQITPLINQKPSEHSPSINYKISCTGNTVWVGGKEAPRSEA